MARTFSDIFPNPKPIIGMIHLAGSNIDGYPEYCVTRALEELRIYANEGVDGAIVEDYHAPDYMVERTLEAVAACNESFRSKVTIGVNCLSSYTLALKLARDYSLPFVQIDQVAGRYVGRGRVFSLDAEQYAAARAFSPGTIILGGVYPKYYLPAPGSDPEVDLRAGMERAEAIVVTGEGTGEETPIEKVREFRRIMGPIKPLLIGAGLNPGNAYAQLSIADGAIVGSAFKPDGSTSCKVDSRLVRGLMDVVQQVRSAR